MKKRKTSTSGDVTSSHQRSSPAIGPRCHAAVISWPVAARTATPAANVSQKPTAIPTRCRRERIASPPPTISTSASASQTDIGPHQNGSGSACSGPSSTKQRTSPKFDGLKMWRPRNVITYFESSPTAAVAGEDPPAVHAPPVAVLGARDAEHERDAVPGQERARGPHQDVLAPERDRRPRAPRRSRARRGSARSRAGSRTPSARAPAASRSRPRGAAAGRGASAAARGRPCRGSAPSACRRRSAGALIGDRWYAPSPRAGRGSA